MKRMSPREARERLVSAERATRRLDPGAARSYARVELGSAALQFGVFVFFALVFAFDWTLTTVIFVIILAMAVSVPIQRGIVRRRTLIPRGAVGLDRFVRRWTPIMVGIAAVTLGVTCSLLDVRDPLYSVAGTGTGAGLIGLVVVLLLGVLFVVPRVLLGVRLRVAAL